MMTTEIERQFFDTFGIKQKELIFRTMNCACGCHDCKNCDKYKNNFSKIYPRLTDRILLELIRLGLNYDFVIHSKSVEELKEKLLALLIYNKAEFKQQVQALFKE